MDDVLTYLTACFGDTSSPAHRTGADGSVARRWLIVATGREPYLSESGKFSHRQWSQEAYPWPRQAAEAVRAIIAAAPSSDVFCCPYPMRSRERAKGNSAGRMLVHADVDRDLDVPVVTELGGFAVSSGTPGHAHVYIPLSYSVTRAQHEMLCRALAEYLDGDTKVSDNDVMRVPATLNHKAAVQGGEPTPVEWLTRPTGARVDPRVLAVVLGVDIAHAERDKNPEFFSGKGDYATVPVDLAEYPVVQEALASNSGDRSVDTMRVVGVCVDTGLSLAQTRWAVRTRADLAARLDEFATRRHPVDDVAQCVTKVAPWLTAAAPAETTTPNGQRSTPSAPTASPLDDALGTFARWLHLDDSTPVLVTAATVVANLVAGEPVWTLLIGPPSSGKTEIVSSLTGLPYIVPAATFTEASLLSGTAARDRTKGATGGLLRRIGEFGILSCKDFTSVLAQSRDTAGTAMAALREIYDGCWDRPVGTDGGRTLHWDGKCGLLGCATPSYDRFHSVVSTLGDRFLLLRLPNVDPTSQFDSALLAAHSGGQMRAELASAMEALVAGADRARAVEPLSGSAHATLRRLASFTARARTGVDRDGYSGEVLALPHPEGTARLGKAMRQLYGALRALGLDDAGSAKILTRMALDCVPAVRVPLMRTLLDEGTWLCTPEVGAAAGLVTKTAHRHLENLALLGVIEWTKHKPAGYAGDTDVGSAAEGSRPRVNAPFYWRATDWLEQHWPGGGEA